MLFNRLFSLVALASLAVPILAAPLPLPKETEFELGPFELEVECEKHKLEIEVELEKYKSLLLPIPFKIEIEIEIGGELVKLVCPTKHEKRDAADRSIAASVLSAQRKLDDFKPQIEEAMGGPLGSIEKKVGNLMEKVHGVVNTLNIQMKSSIGSDRSIVYGNPSGETQLTEIQLSKFFCTFLLHISQIEDSVKHVSGYKFTSAQQRIREDLISMKKALGTISPEVLSGAANMMAMALSMGHGVIA